MQLTINGVGTTPVTLILDIPSCRIHPNIIPHQFPCIWSTMESLKHSSGWLMGYFHYPTSYSAKSRCHDSKATATQPLSRPRPPPPPANESADEVDCVVARRPLWMAAVHRWMRRVDGLPWLPCLVGSFGHCFSGPKGVLLMTNLTVLSELVLVPQSPMAALCRISTTFVPS